MSLSSKQSRLFSFYSLPSIGKLNGSLVHNIECQRKLLSQTFSRYICMFLWLGGPPSTVAPLIKKEKAINASKAFSQVDPSLSINIFYSVWPTWKENVFLTVHFIFQGWNFVFEIWVMFYLKIFVISFYDLTIKVARVVHIFTYLLTTKTMHSAFYVL